MLAPKKDAFALAMASGAGIKAAAGVVGMPARTCYTWAREDEVRARVAEIRADLTTQAIGKLTATAAEAAEILATIMRDENTPAQTRVTAARAILSDLLALESHAELKAKIEALEERVSR